MNVRALAAGRGDLGTMQGLLSFIGNIIKETVKEYLSTKLRKFRGKRQMAMHMTRETMKALTAHIIAVLLVLLLAAVSLLAISGAVDLSNSAVSLFIGSLTGLIAGLLASPLQHYYGRPPKLPHSKDVND